MKNRIYYLTLLFGLLFAMGLTAQNFNSRKIYIDPGHDGFGSNDRNVATINYGVNTNGNGFYESVANVNKGLELRRLLQACGANVMMSRTTTPQTKSLSARVTEANNFGAALLHSIHSNAFDGGTTNYLLLLHHNTNYAQSAVTYAQALWPKMFDNPLTNWSSYSATNTNIRGQALTVVSMSSRPAILSEGSFHDYGPETHRLLAPAYCKMEGYNIFRGLCAYYGLGNYSKGAIVGHAKDNTKSITASNPANGSRYLQYRSGTHDAYWPINGTKAELLNSAGTSVLQTYTVDNNYNGVFGFFDVNPGSYKVRLSANGYQCKVVDVTVTAGGLASVKQILVPCTGNNCNDCGGDDGGDDDPVTITNYVVGTTMNAPYDPLLTVPYTVAIGNQVAAVGIHPVSGTGWEARTDNFTWTSSATNIATVNYLGQINGIADGTTTIKAVVTNGNATTPTSYPTGSSLSFTLKVGTGGGGDEPGEPGNLTVRICEGAPSNTAYFESVAIGQESLTWGIFYEGGPINTRFSFEVVSSNPNIAEISGLDVIPKANGTVTISAVGLASGSTGLPALTGPTHVTPGKSLVGETGSMVLIVGTGTAIDTQKTPAGINIYATPTGIAAEFEGEALVELYNLSGILIDKVKVNQFYSKDLTKGIYLIRINGQTIKFVKK